MNYCSQCGQPVTVEVPPGDNRPRHVCRSCGQIHYENPRVVVGCVPEFDGSILLCRRAIEPRHGYWTVPAGFMELGETLGEAAIRETWEEAQARVELGPLFAVVDVVHARQVHVFFRGDPVGTGFRCRRGNAGDRASSVRRTLPWQRDCLSERHHRPEAVLCAIRSRATGRCTSPPPRGFVLT